MIKTSNVKPTNSLNRDSFGRLTSKISSEKILMQFMIEDTRVTTESEENWADLQLILSKKNEHSMSNKW
jgi:hypothetical protein